MSLLTYRLVLKFNFIAFFTKLVKNFTIMNIIEYPLSATVIHPTSIDVNKLYIDTQMIRTVEFLPLLIT